MARGKKKQTASEVSGDVPSDQVESSTVAVAEQPTGGSTGKEEPPFEPTGFYTPTADEMERPRSQSRGRFRSWVNDPTRGYSRLSDEEQRRIVLTFNEKPPADLLAAIKDAGFQYHPDYHGMKNAWTRYNDHEGRIQAEGIDSLVRSLIPGVESPQR